MGLRWNAKVARRVLPAALPILVGSGLAAPAATAKDLGLAGAGGGVTVSGSAYRYTAMSPQTPGNRLTVIAQTSRRDGRVGRWWYLPGNYQVPPLTYNGSAGGLSADGSTLVLSRFSWIYPPRTSGFAILDTRLHLRHPRRAGEPRPRRAVTRVRLPGGFSFEAISPDGSTIYLIHHLSPYAGGAFQIRALESRSGELLPRPIVDPSEPVQSMTGEPVARATSPDGRWAYTLFAGTGHERGKWGEPFIDALDTVGRRATRVDLPQLIGRRSPFVPTLRMKSHGRDLLVLDRPPSIEGSRPLLTVDTRSFRVTEPGAVNAKGSGNLSWLAIALVPVSLACVVTWAARRRRRTVDDNRLDRA